MKHCTENFESGGVDVPEGHWNVRAISLWPPIELFRIGSKPCLCLPTSLHGNDSSEMLLPLTLPPDILLLSEAATALVLDLPSPGSSAALLPQEHGVQSTLKWQSDH